MNRAVSGLLLVVALGVLPGHAQDASDRGGPESQGLHLYDVSVYSGYSTLAYPYGVSQVPLQGAGSLGGDTNYGGSITVGGQWHRPKTDFMFQYTGSYNGMVRYSNVNAFGHVLSLSASRRLTSKWTLSLSANGQDLTMAQYLYQPPVLATMVQAPATFDDLAAAFSIGQFSNAQIASMLTGAPIIQSPGQSLLFGDHLRSYGANVSASYAATSRLTLHLSSFAAGGEQISAQSGPIRGNYLMPFTIGMTGGMGLSYAVSPRTTLGLDVEESRLRNSFQTSYTTTATASAGRKMGEHWFLRAYGGGAYIKTVQQLYGYPVQRQWLAGGSIGFKTYQNALVASYDRSAMDNFGFAVGAVTSAGGSWTWHRPGSGWRTSLGFQRQLIQDTGYYSLSGWQGMAGLERYLNRHTTLSVQYVYLNTSGNFLGTRDHITVQSVRVALGWSPQLSIQ